MKYDLGEIEQREVIKKIINFLENNKNNLELYLKLPEFKDNINCVYNSLKTVSYDSLEFPINNSVDPYESNNYFYYSFIQSDICDDKKITVVVKKDLSNFYFLETDKKNNCKMANYYKDKNEKINYYIKNFKKNKSIINEEDGEIKSLILKLEKDNHY